MDLSSGKPKEINWKNINYLPNVALEIYVKKENEYTQI